MGLSSSKNSEPFCSGCGGKDYSLEQDTWSCKSSLSPSGYDPFTDMGLGKECYYPQLQHAWTRSANITPSNLPTMHSSIVSMTMEPTQAQLAMPIEFYDRAEYAKLGSAWSLKEKYTA